VKEKIFKFFSVARARQAQRSKQASQFKLREAEWTNGLL